MICWASTSSGASGICRVSSSPRRTQSSRAAHSIRSSRVVANKTALGGAADLVPGATDPLQKSRNRARRGDLADQVDVANVDPQLQRRRGDQHLQLAALEPLLGIQAKLLGQAAMVGGHGVLAETFAQVAAQAFGQAPGVDENQRGPVFAGEGRRGGRTPIPRHRWPLPLTAELAALQCPGPVGGRGRCR